MPFSGASLTPRHLAVYNELQREASAYPGAQLKTTEWGPIWMTPIEADLHSAFGRIGLSPVPQFCILGYFVDFAFPGVLLAIEADGHVHDDPAHAQHDRRRDNVLRSAGWTVMRFHGTTIFHKADNCAYVVSQEIAARMNWITLNARRRAELEQTERQFFHHPLKALGAWFTLLVSPSPSLPVWPIVKSHPSGIARFTR